MLVKAYTSVVGDIDKKREDITCFTEHAGFTLDVRNAKIYKCLPHKYLNCDISIYVDGNIFLLETPEKIAELLGDADIALFKHPSRTNIWDEAEAIKQWYPQKLVIGEVDEQITAYKTNGVEPTIPLCECGVLIRRHNDQTVTFNEAWWAEICRYSFRDQLSFPVVASFFPNLKIKYLEGSVNTHKYFKFISHI
jgi:hypothetical protein